MESFEDASYHQKLATLWAELAKEYSKSNNPISVDLAAQARKDACWHQRYAEKITNYGKLVLKNKELDK